jgi:hypothetical protein
MHIPKPFLVLRSEQTTVLTQNCLVIKWRQKMAHLSAGSIGAGSRKRDLDRKAFPTGVMSTVSSYSY